MQPVIYDVAVSIDGHIAGPNEDIAQFAHGGPVVDDYMARLATYSCAIMGRATYEFGYRFGLEPGRNPYPAMQTYVFSTSIDLPDHGEVTVVGMDTRDVLHALRERQSGPIYLCGGGKFAGWLLSEGLIDIVRLKRAPIFLGSGTRLFDGVAFQGEARCTESKLYENGTLFQEFALRSAAARR